MKHCDLTNAEMPNCPNWRGEPGEECDWFDTGRCYRPVDRTEPQTVFRKCGTCKHWINQRNLGGYGFCSIPLDGGYMETRSQDNTECKEWEATDGVQ